MAILLFLAMSQLAYTHRGKLSVGAPTHTAIDSLPIFASASVGLEGIKPRSVSEWQAIMRSWHADSIFKHLLKSKNIPTQLYGLAGVYRTDRGYFDRIAPRFLNRQDSVAVYIGCVIYPEPIGKIAKEIQSGVWTEGFRTGRPMEQL